MAPCLRVHPSCYLPPLMAVLIGVMTVQVKVEARVFTDKEGQTFSGEVVGVLDSNVTIKLENGKTVTLKMSELSGPDLVYAQDWQTAERKRKPATVDVTMTEETKTKKEKYSREISLITYVITVRNRSGRPLLGISVSTRGEIFTDNGKDLKPTGEPIERNLIERLEPNEQRVIRCRPISLTKSSMDTSISVSEGGRGVAKISKLEEKLKKFTVEVTAEGKKIWTSP